MWHSKPALVQAGPLRDVISLLCGGWQNGENVCSMRDVCNTSAKLL